MILFADVACFVSIAMLAWTLRGKFEDQSCERLDLSCPCQNRKRDERGRFTR